MHEIITLQFGQRANYLATHYWNTQESYFTYDSTSNTSPVDHDISFRPGISPDGNDTYTPRTLIYDLKGAFGTLRRENALFQLQEEENPARNGPWSGSTIPLHLPLIAPSPYQQALDAGAPPPQLTPETVRYWSDYNHIFHHPRSIVQLNEYELNSSLMPFEQWGTGEELFQNLDREHDLLDRDLRLFLEECDQLQGIQIFSSADDAWGGFTAKYLERISDELGKGSRWVFGLKDGRPQTRAKQMLQTVNFAHSMLAFDTHASVHTPMSITPSTLPSYIRHNPSSLWHTSALEAALVESITLPTRLHQTETSQASLSQLETTLNNSGHRRIVSAGLSLEDPATPAPATNGDSTHDTRMTNGLTHEDDELPTTTAADINFFPTTTSTRQVYRRNHLFSQITTLRTLHPLTTPQQPPHPSLPRTHTAQTSLLLPLLPSYPQLYHFPNHRPPLESLALTAQLSASSGVATGIRELERLVRGGVGVEEREGLRDGLVGMAEEYEEGWVGSEGEDED